METVKVDHQKRVRLPGAKPGQVFDYSESAGGAIMLTPVKELEEPALAEPKLVKKNGFTVVDLGRPLDMEAVNELLADWP